MSKHVKHVPKHRAAPARPALPVAPRKVIGTTVVLSSLAVAATGATISGGLLMGSDGPATANAADGSDRTKVQADLASAPLSTSGGDSDSADDSSSLGIDPELAARAAEVEPLARTTELSRSADRREATDPLKAAALTTEAEGPVEAGSQDLSDADPRDIARALLAEFGFGADQFSCLDSLYIRESNWNPYADNPSSSAYGIPQALPGSKMASAGADWATNPVTQIRWGLGYIQDRYGSPCGAWGHSQSHGWY
ncbi:lytic transglycosylase domain-containing protein [Nocardioides sp. GXZ039]|uniref:aggregation-promoting factor C-terminal-like domain-containing protein n=1 Tax=Nocardioides sp. GXZ039 TaxID=3136018 RepID=UPI0030F3F4FF